MRITPKLALTTTAILVAVGLLWVGFVEGGRSQIPGNQGSPVSGAAGQYPNQFIAAGTLTAATIPGFALTGASPAAPQRKDNVPALALSGTVIVSLVMLALAFARFQTIRPTGEPAVHSETATRRRTRLVTTGPPSF